MKRWVRIIVTRAQDMESSIALLTSDGILTQDYAQKLDHREHCALDVYTVPALVRESMKASTWWYSLTDLLGRTLEEKGL